MQLASFGLCVPSRHRYLRATLSINLWYLLAATQRRRIEEWKPPHRIAESRLRRLQRLVKVACGTPYYREVFRRSGVTPSDFLSETALEALPLVEKSTLQEHGRDTTVNPSRPGLFEVRTSGSTGEPHRLYRDHRDQAEISALYARFFRAFGHRLRYRQVNIGSGRPVAAKGPVALLRRTGVLPALHQLSSFDPLDRQIDFIRRVQPHMISAYSVALEQLVEAVLEAGVRDIQPRIVYSSSMALSERCCSLTQEAFGVRPFDVYATVEAGPLAWECPARLGALHLNDDVQVLEIVDPNGRRLPDGELGEVVVTSLTTLTQPLIRYRIGDLGYRLTDQCHCGRGLALMAPVQGRTKHTIRTPDGRVLNSAVVGSCISPFAEVRRWQVQQTAPDALRVLIVPAAGWADESANAVLRSLGSKLGQSFRLELVTVETIPLAPSGKFQTIVPLKPPPANESTSPASESVRRSPPSPAGCE